MCVFRLKCPVGMEIVTVCECDMMAVYCYKYLTALTVIRCVGKEG
jgi:hypothetical protein